MQSLRHSVQSEQLGVDLKPHIKAETSSLRAEEAPSSEDRKPKRGREEVLRSEDRKPKREELPLREDKKPKVEERPSGPSEAFIAAYREIRGIPHSEDVNDGEI